MQILLCLAVLIVDGCHGVYLFILIPGEKNGLFPAALLAVTAIPMNLAAALQGVMLLDCGSGPLSNAMVCFFLVF